MQRLRVLRPLIVILLLTACGAVAHGSPSHSPAPRDSLRTMPAQTATATPEQEAVRIQLSGETSASIVLPTAPDCSVENVPTPAGRALVLDLPSSTGLVLAVPSYAGTGTYSPAVVIAQDGGVAVRFMNPALGVSRSQNEYDASSGTINVTSVSGNVIQGSVTASLQPFASAPGTEHVEGDWTCHLSATGGQ